MKIDTREALKSLHKKLEIIQDEIKVLLEVEHSYVISDEKPVDESRFKEIVQITNEEIGVSFYKCYYK
jgi:hypothetical protein